MQNGPALICFDIFCDSGRSLSAIINQLADDNTYQAILGFTPKRIGAASMRKSKAKIFCLSTDKENIFKENKLMFRFYPTPGAALNASTARARALLRQQPLLERP